MRLKTLLDRPIVRLMLWALLVRFLVALAALPLPEYADQPMYKEWVQAAMEEGIYRAYSWGYDWLPFYLYVCKLVGLVYRYTGLEALFGAQSPALTLLLKLPMLLLNVLLGWLIYRLVDHLYGSDGRPLLAAGVYLFNPAIILASAVFGYQDALHTTLVFLAVVALCMQRKPWVPVLCALAFLTKPQAALFLLPICTLYLLRTGLRRTALGVGAGVATAGVVLLPFIVHGELDSVFQMYLDVPRVHKWLTGLAHNIWWIQWPVPPFKSDRIPLVWGLNGLTLGLTLFGLFTLGALIQLARRPTNATLVHVCAFLAFAFYMVVTQIHENHLYAMFSFLAVFVAVSRPLRGLYVGLTITFGLGLVLALYLFRAHAPVMLGPIRVSMVNAWANVAMLVIWSYLTLVREIRLDPAPRPAERERPEGGRWTASRLPA